MCEPTTMMVLTAASTGLQMVGQWQQQRSQEEATKAMAEYNMKLAANQMDTERQLADAERRKGAAEQSRQAREAARQRGAMAAAMGAGGFELDSGSNLDLLADSAQEAQYDYNIIGANAAQAAWQHDVAATNALNDYNSYAAQKANAKSGRGAALLNMGATLLGGIGAGMEKWHDWGQSSTPTTTTTTTATRPPMTGTNTKTVKKGLTTTKVYSTPAHYVRH